MSQQETFAELVGEPDKRWSKFFETDCSVHVNTGVKIEQYVRSGKEMLRMGNVYYAEKNKMQAFIIYSRYLILFLQKLKNHPKYGSIDPTEIAKINKQVKTIVFPRAEELKKHIKDIFAKEADQYRKDQALKAESKPVLPAVVSPSVNIDAEKQRYNQENEAQLRQLQAEELERSIKLPTAPEEEPVIQVAQKIEPQFDRSLKPQVNHEVPVNKYNIRVVVVPADLCAKFTDYAAANTGRNVETCGILAGKLSHNQFVISHCILPKQMGTSDTCSTDHEHELFDIMDSQDLITLGWIHTHPSQTAFLSSIDLHTQYGYQVMIPEAIAIVIAPTQKEIGMFILSPGYGLKEIADCTKSGFHPHTNSPPLFEECDHIQLNKNMRTEIIDLRIMTELLSRT